MTIGQTQANCQRTESSLHAMRPTHVGFGPMKDLYDTLDLHGHSCTSNWVICLTITRSCEHAPLDGNVINPKRVFRSLALIRSSNFPWRGAWYRNSLGEDVVQFTLNVGQEPYMQAHISDGDQVRRCIKVEQDLHLWLEDSSTNIFHWRSFQYVSLIVSNTIHVEYCGHQ